MTLEFDAERGDAPLRPNVLFVLLDDVALEALGIPQLAARHAQMGIDAATFGFPRTDTLRAWADSGVVFDDVWTGSRCSPSRAMALTGRYAFRSGVGIVVREDELPQPGDPTSGEFGNQGQELTLPRVLRERYDCAHVGKYHLALNDDPASPLAGSGMVHAKEVAGWPTVRGILTNPYARIGGLELGLPPAADGFEPGYWNWYWHDNAAGGGLVTEQRTGLHLTEHTREQAVSWIRDTAGEPWCAWVAFNAAHTPYGPKTGDPNSSGLDPTGSGLGTYGAWPGLAVNNWDCYRAGIENLDKELGRLAAQLGPGRMARTLLVVVGDNGLPGGQVLRSMKAAESASLSPPYSELTNERVKSSVYSAGVRNWMIVKGPPHVVRQPGRVSSVPVDLVDVFETIRDVALVPAPPTTIDGVSLKQVLKSPANEPAHPRTFHYSENFAPNGDPKDLVSGAVTAQVPPFSSARHEWDRAYAMPVDGTWFKLIRRFDNMGGEREELYELDDDPYEQVDLAASPELAATRAALGAALDALLAS